MKTFGLLGYPLEHSFSKDFFRKKFEELGLQDHEYINFELDSIDRFPEILDYKNEVFGLNCTIPYKEQVMQYLDDIDDDAFEVGAVNTIKFNRDKNGRIELIGYNTDVIGFENSIKPMLRKKHKKALVLGTGGASKAIRYVLKKLGISVMLVSRTPAGENELSYDDINAALLKEYMVIINATPLGTFPKINVCPDIPYEDLSTDHVLFDVVYNPEVSLFLKKGMEQGAAVKNGYEMLQGQAEAAWKIWNE